MYSESGEQLDLVKIVSSTQGVTTTTVVAHGYDNGKLSRHGTTWKVNGSEVLVPEFNGRGSVQANGDIVWNTGVKAVQWLPPRSGPYLTAVVGG